MHKNERVSWFTAVNRCLSNNASLAVFDDNVRQYFPSSVLSEQAWIGLLKPLWTWPSLSKCKLSLTIAYMFILLLNTFYAYDLCLYKFGLKSIKTWISSKLIKLHVFFQCNDKLCSIWMYCLSIYWHLWSLTEIMIILFAMLCDVTIHNGLVVIKSIVAKKVCVKYSLQKLIDCLCYLSIFWWNNVYKIYWCTCACMVYLYFSGVM